MAPQLRIDIREDDAGLYFEYSRPDTGGSGHLARHRPALEPSAADIRAEIRGLFDLAFRGSSGWLGALDQWGRRAFSDFIPDAVRDEILSLESASITWVIGSAAAAAVPWELCHDGKDFLARRHVCGRLLTGPESPAKAVPQRNGRFLIVADPAGDLPAAYREGESLASFLEQNTSLSLQGKPEYSRPQLLTSAGIDLLREEIRQNEIVHFCGHSRSTGQESDSGWLLENSEILNLGDIRGLARYSNVPQLIFSNSCASGENPESGEAALSGIAGAFLSAGVYGYIGTLCRIEDQAAADFAMRFYQLLGNGRGHAANLHRVQSETPLADPAWAAYRYYGDPVQRAFEDDTEGVPSSSEGAGDVSSMADHAVSRFGSHARKKRLIFILAVCFAAACLVGAYLFFRHSDKEYRQNFIYIEGSGIPTESRP